MTDKPDSGFCRVLFPRDMTVKAVAAALDSLRSQLLQYDGQAKVTRFRPVNEGTKDHPSYAFHVGINGGDTPEKG